MTIFRWVFGVFSLLLAAGGALSFLVYIAQGENDWLKLAHKFRRWTSAALRLKGLAASFGAIRLMALASEAATGQAHDGAVLRRLHRAIERL